MPPGGQSQGGEADNSFAVMWICIGVFVLCAFIWYFFSDYIISFVLAIRDYEAKFLSLFIPQGWSKSLEQLQQFITTAKASGYANVKFDDLIYSSTTVGNFLRYPVGLILIVLAIVIYVGNPIAKYKKTYTMKRLLIEEKSNWPQITPVSKLDLVNTDLDKGPWAMSMPPMPFATKNNLLIVEKVQPGDSQLRAKAILIASVNRDEARKVFALQVGPYWLRPEALPIHRRALFAVFAARIAGDRDQPQKLLARIAASSETGKMDFSGTDELLKKHKEDKQVQNLIKKHAYVLTVMASMLQAARGDGVVACSDFLWLKPIDRKLWFMLNCVGRQTAFAEISGPFAHWLAEKDFGRKINVPMVEEAVNGLSDAIKEMIYIPPTEEDSDAA